MPKEAEPHQVTRLLGEIAEGKDSARGELVTAVYDQLRKIAQLRMGGGTIESHLAGDGAGA